MSIHPDRTDTPTATPEAPPGPGPARPVPPVAERIPRERAHHGDTVVDEYAWLAGKDTAEMIAYLEAENAYTAAMTAGQAGLRETIFSEIKGRTRETDLSVPARKGGWWYYTQDRRGQAVHGALPVRRPSGPDRPAADGRGRAGRPAARRGGPARRQRAGGGRAVLLARRVQRQPGRPAAGLLDGFRRRRTLHAADQGPGDRASSVRTRSPTPTTAAPGPRTVPRCSTSRPTRPGVPTGCGGIWWAPRPPTT